MSQPDAAHAEMSDDVVMTVRDATVRFGMERGETRVLDAVDMDIHRGEVLGVVGESGSGKSMFASALVNAVVEPGELAGEVHYHYEDGESVDLLAIEESELKSMRWEEIAFVLQGAQSAFNPTMTIRRHFEETLSQHSFDLEPGMQRARDLLEELHLPQEQVLDSYAHELSGGMKQRALIALSMVLEPEVLIFDEPTASLDLLMQRSIISLLNQLQKEHDLTMLFITHDLALVSDIADRLAVMYAFQFVEVGETRELLGEVAHPYTRALFNAVPNLTTPESEMRPIPGSSPDPVDVPQGCSYHPRCPIAQERCQKKEPELAPLSDTGHRAACFYSERAVEEIPMNVPGLKEALRESGGEGNSSQDSIPEEKSQRNHKSEGGVRRNIDWEESS